MNDLDSWLLRSSRMLPPNGNADRYVMGACLAALAFLVIGIRMGWF